MFKALAKYRIAFIKKTKINQLQWDHTYSPINLLQMRIKSETVGKRGVAKTLVGIPIIFQYQFGINSCAIDRIFV